MNLGQKIIDMIFVTYNEASEVLKPGKQALNPPSAPIASELPAVLGFRFFPAFAMRGNHLNATIFKQPIVRFIAITGFISDQFVRRIFGKAAVYGILDKLYLMGRSAFDVAATGRPAASAIAMILVPCDKTNFDPHLGKRWAQMNMRMKEIGVEVYYEETKDLCRYR